MVLSEIDLEARLTKLVVPRNKNQISVSALISNQISRAIELEVMLYNTDDTGDIIGEAGDDTGDLVDMFVGEPGFEAVEGGLSSHLVREPLLDVPALG